MLTSKRIEERLQDAQSWKGPLLSAYIPLEPETGNVDRVATRVRSTFNDLDVPDDVTKKVIEEITTGTHSGQTLVVFEGPDVSERFALAVDIPVVNRTSGHFEASYGDRAYVAPMLLALDRAEPLGVVFVDRERVRVFATHLDEIEELMSEESEPAPDQSHTASSSKQVRPAYQAVRDDAHEDRREDHRREVRSRFYDDVIQDIAEKFEAAGVERFVIMGPERPTAAFERELPTPLAEKIALRTSSLPAPDVPAVEVLDKLRPEIERLSQERQAKMVETIASQQGAVHGTAETLTQLQQGRVDTVVLPWHPGEARPLFVASSGWVGATREDARAHDGEGEIDQVDLMEILPTLTSRFGANLKFVLGDARDKLGNGELGAILRW